MNATYLKLPACILVALVGLAAGPDASRGQSVAVTVLLDTNQLDQAQTTTLHVRAQVVPTLRASAAQIFSWYVDVLNTNGAVASASYNAMLKSPSDNDSQTSSKGVDGGANRYGVYDTFLNLPGAGVTNSVELMSIPVTGLAPGKTRFLVRAGTGVPLSSDFVVAPLSGSSPYVGGDYSAAFADLTVVGSVPCALSLVAVPLAGNGGPGGTLQLTFTPCPGRTHTVEYRAALGDLAGWQALPGAPHNSGSVIVTNTASLRFFRVRASSP